MSATAAPDLGRRAGLALPALRAVAVAGGFATALALAGCNSAAKGEDVHAFVAKVRAQPVAPIEPAPKISSYKPFQYKAEGRRSPFTPRHPQKKKTAYTGPKPDPQRPRGPLEQFSLDGLKMMGTVTSGAVNYALVQTPAGVIYRVKRGQYLGTHSGKIIAIRPNGLLIREIVPKASGGYQKRTTALAVGQ